MKISFLWSLSAWSIELKGQGVVSLTFRELSEIISQKYTIPENTFILRISSWNFVRVPKAWLWAHLKIWAWNSHQKYDFCNTHKSRENILENLQSVNETPPKSWKAFPCYDIVMWQHQGILFRLRAILLPSRVILYPTLEGKATCFVYCMCFWGISLSTWKE